MAKEFGPIKLNQAGLTTLGLTIFKRPGLQWNFTDGAYAAVDPTTNWTQKVVALTDAGSGWYYADIASGDPTDPQAEVFIVEKQGASFAATDPSIANGPLPHNILDVAAGVETGLTLRQSLRLITSALAGKTAVSGSTVTHRDINDTKARITATVNSAGERSAITTDTT